MRILFFQEIFWPSIGGVEIMALKHLLDLRQRGHELMVLTGSDSRHRPTADQYERIPIYRLPFLSALNERNVDRLIEIRLQVVELKRTFAPDLVHLYSFGPSSFFHFDTVSAHPAPSLITIHSEPKFFAHGLPKRFLSSADWVVGCSADSLKYSRRLVPTITARSSVIHNGLTVPALFSAPLPIKNPRLLCLGRLSEEKGFDSALKAFSLLVTRFPNLRLTLAGDGPMRRELEQIIAQKRLQDRVDVIGWVPPDSVPSLINTATVVVIPSRREGLPLVALEAGLMARPVVATHVGGVPEVVVHYETGLLVEEEDSTALAEAIAFLLDNPDTAQRMGQAARKRVIDTFSLQRHVNAYETLYCKLVSDWQRNQRIKN